jgi:Lar family restriction alleviation protein
MSERNFIAEIGDGKHISWGGDDFLELRAYLAASETRELDLLKQLAEVLKNRNKDYAMIGGACGILMRNGFTNASVDIAKQGKKVLATFVNASVRAETAEARVCELEKHLSEVIEQSAKQHKTKTYTAWDCKEAIICPDCGKQLIGRGLAGAHTCMKKPVEGKELMKPCPFCGGKAVTWPMLLYNVHCLQCGAKVVALELQDAINQWNRRAAKGE